MRTIFFSAALVAGCAVLACSFNPAFAQAPAGEQPAARLGINGMAVVDIEYIFKNHHSFKQQMDQLKQQMEAADADARRDQEELRKLAEQVKQYGEGTPEFKQKEAELMKRHGDLNLKVSLMKKEFMEKEGRVYFNVSREIDDAVKVIANKNGIVLVVRFNGDPVDPNNRNDIVRNIGKSVVYNDPRMDITPYVLHELNRGSGATPTASAPGSTVPVRRQ